jgi:hypothetical protein
MGRIECSHEEGVARLRRSRLASAIMCGDPWRPIEVEAARTPPNSSRARKALNKLTSPRQLSEELL